MKALAVRLGSQAREISEPTRDLEKLKAAFLQASTFGTLESLPKRSWERLPNILWFGTDPQLAEVESVMEAFQRRLRGNVSALALRNLAACYVREFRPASTAFGRIATMLRDAHSQDMAGGTRRWRELQSDLEIFDPAKITANIGRELIRNADESVETTFANLKIPGWSQAGRLGLASLEATLSLIREALADRNVSPRRRGSMLQLIAAWIDPEVGIPSLPIRLQVDMANALLLPWGSGPAPSDSLRKFVVELVLKRVGDPRIVSAVWQLPEVEEAKQRFLSWLALGTIEQFFQVIDDTAGQDHWQQRREFWAWYAERSFVTDAWVAFGPVATRQAKALREVAPFAFGELTQARLRHHSVLFLRIGPLVIADYSHDGSCRFYNAGEWQPTLYESTYEDTLLRENATEAIGHRGYWQAPFAAYVRRQTGVRSDYEWR